MTKLFSMKSLAFAGAAAFAVALAAAPQADAAENLAIGDAYLNDPTITEVSVAVSSSAVTITNGKLEYYYSSAKKGNEPKKWVSVSTTDYGFSGGKLETSDKGNCYFYVPITEITKGKEADVYIATNAEGTNKSKIECKAAPKIKATFKMLTSGPSIAITGSDKKELNTGNIILTSQYGGFSLLNNLYMTEVKGLATDGNEELMEVLGDIADFGGGSLNVVYYSDDNMTPPATAKLKIAATPKAPKESLKIAKAFTFKPKKETLKYRTFVKDGIEPEKWSVSTDGAAIPMNTLFGAENVSSTLAENEYVLNNTMQLQSRTTDPKGKKADSKITTTTVYASAATPQAVNAAITNDVKTGKTTTTGASITFATTGLDLTQSKSVSSGAVVTLQYKTNDSKSKWTDAKATAVKFASGKVPSEIYVRVKGVDYTAAKKDKKACYYEAPGHIMTIKIDANNPEGATYSTTSSSVFVPAANAIY